MFGGVCEPKDSAVMATERRHFFRRAVSTFIPHIQSLLSQFGQLFFPYCWWPRSGVWHSFIISRNAELWCFVNRPIQIPSPLKRRSLSPKLNESRSTRLEIESTKPLPLADLYWQFFGCWDSIESHLPFDFWMIVAHIFNPLQCKFHSDSVKAIEFTFHFQRMLSGSGGILQSRDRATRNLCEFRD
jgi:hypothetical protein